MNWISGCDRQQRLLLPQCVEDYVPPDNPVRLIDAFVDSRDLAVLGFKFPKANSQDRGRPAYHPGLLLKLYLYGYQHQVRSSRRLEAECRRNLELIWLLGQLAPDFKTIADFRKDNAQAFKAVVREFNQVCRELALFGGELIAIDGTKLKGQNSPAKNWSVTKLEKQQQKLEARLEEYLKALDQADAQEPTAIAGLSRAQLEEKIEQLKARQASVVAKQQCLEALGQTQLSATDPESRSMKSANGFVVGYNVQGAVDAKHHLLAVTEVTNRGVDQGQLAPVAKAAKEELALQRAAVVADGGYFTAEDVKTCQEMGLEVHLPPSHQSPSERAGRFGKSVFGYDPQKDVYRCPAGHELQRRRQVRCEGWLSYDHPAACASCPLKGRCTQSAYRTVTRWEHEVCLERMTAQVAAQPEKLRRRKELIEHCWGTLKWLLPGGFLVKGLRKVGAEVALAHFAYNLKRALHVVGFQRLLEALKKAGGHGPRPGRGEAERERLLGVLSAIRLAA